MPRSGATTTGPTTSRAPTPRGRRGPTASRPGWRPSRQSAPATTSCARRATASRWPTSGCCPPSTGRAWAASCSPTRCAAPSSWARACGCTRAPSTGLPRCPTTERAACAPSGRRRCEGGAARAPPPQTRAPLHPHAGSAVPAARHEDGGAGGEGDEKAALDHGGQAPAVRGVLRRRRRGPRGDGRVVRRRRRRQVVLGVAGRDGVDGAGHVVLGVARRDEHGVVSVADVAHVLGAGRGGNEQAQRADAGQQAASEHVWDSLVWRARAWWQRTRRGGRGRVRPRPLRDALLYTPMWGARLWRRATRATPPIAKAASRAASPSAAICQPLSVSSLDALGADAGVVVGLVVP